MVASGEDLLQQLIHALRSLHFTWQVDLGIAVTVISWARLLVWRGRMRLNHGRQHWRSIEAGVLYGTVKDFPNLSRWVATITYSYFVGEFRSGEFAYEFRSEAAAADFVRNAKERSILVWFDPKRPDRSAADKIAISQLVRSCVDLELLTHDSPGPDQPYSSD